MGAAVAGRLPFLATAIVLSRGPSMNAKRSWSSTPATRSSSNTPGPHPAPNTSETANPADPARPSECHRCPDTSSVTHVLMQNCHRCRETSQPTIQICGGRGAAGPDGLTWPRIVHGARPYGEGSLRWSHVGTRRRTARDTRGRSRALDISSAGSRWRCAGEPAQGARGIGPGRLRGRGDDIHARTGWALPSALESG